MKKVYKCCLLVMASGIVWYAFVNIIAQMWVSMWVSMTIIKCWNIIYLNNLFMLFHSYFHVNCIYGWYCVKWLVIQQLMIFIETHIETHIDHMIRSIEICESRISFRRHAHLYSIHHLVWIFRSQYHFMEDNFFS